MPLFPSDSAGARLACVCSSAVLVLGVVARTFDAAVLAPPLGVSVFSCLRAPDAPENAPRNVVLGHAVGIAAGMFAWFACGGAELEGALGGAFTLRHALASALAVGITVFASSAAGVLHPPALATTLIASLGHLGSWSDTAGLAGGSLLVAAATAALRARRATTARDLLRVHSDSSPLHCGPSRRGCTTDRNDAEPRLRSRP